ncbi:hypothetical protein EYZ11_012313 [Aspergillus tanneri]|uniref:Amino acid permease/ SLC12A domain-containing protein n=1 Tax=Aspergillus tanneri TaxID=1220188 RepID=A0A4S3J0U0_9EURO|nr:hypothetical protein EYZ11_012313 [Aspergillus tanneri]
MYFITTSGYISWLCSCILYLRFRRTTKAQGFVRVHQTFVQPYGAYFAILVCTVLFLANLLMTVIPSKDALRDPIAVYLGILTFLLLYIGHSAKYPFSRIADSEAGEQCSETIEIPHPRVERMNVE